MNKPVHAPWQMAAIIHPYDHLAMLCGIATGKTYTGSHFAIRMIQEHPNLTGFIGANTYDQLSQATLREFFYWLDMYGMEYVVDRKPPEGWKVNKRLKTYKNTIIVLHQGIAVIVFTRVLSKANPLRGTQFSWYWIDESRDTPENTHDVILSRLRESKDFRKGLVTTTTNAEDWAYKRFVKNPDPRFGSMHVATKSSLDFGIISKTFYDTLRSSYSPMMAAQELDALHVNVRGGRAYYASGQHNKRKVAPWGDKYPNPIRPLVIGCDFNFSPAPCVWMVGQVGPELVDPTDGIMFSDKIHWFGHIVMDEASSEAMTLRMISRYPDFFYEIYGDASGTRGTTSNAGENDYAIIGNTLADNNCDYSIDVNNSNPLVKDRVEAMNALFMNGMGHVRQTYDPELCEFFESDCNVVGWKKTNTALGKLDGAGDVNRTHATDGAGYYVYKKFPTGRRAFGISKVSRRT